jgi:hypothetical protein
MVMMRGIPFSQFSALNLFESPQYGFPKSSKVNLNSDLTFGELGKAFHLKQLWKTSLGLKVSEVVQGQNGKFFVVLYIDDVVLAVNSNGKIDTEFRCVNPYNVVEGKNRVYITTTSRQLLAFDKNGHRLWEVRLPNNTGYSSYSPVEDSQGNIWVIHNDWVFRFSSDGKMQGDAYIGGVYRLRKSIAVDSKGNVYTTNVNLVRISQNMQKKEIFGLNQEPFLAADIPFVIQGDRLYKLNFEEASPNDKVEILHWNNDKTPLKPVVAQNGDIHILLRGDDNKSALYVVVAPKGFPAQGGLRYKKKSQVLQFGISDVSPVLTPEGTLYMIAQTREGNHGWNYSLQALDRFGNLHSFPLKEEPKAIVNLDKEKVAVVFESGTAMGFEAKSIQEILEERKKEELKQKTLNEIEKG